CNKFFRTGLYPDEPIRPWSHMGIKRPAKRVLMTTKPKMSNWLAALAVVIGGGVQAQDFSIDWFGLAGGGGSSLGGDVQLSATIGQPAIGEISGGDFNIIAGF